MMNKINELKKVSNIQVKDLPGKFVKIVYKTEKMISVEELYGKITYVEEILSDSKKCCYISLYVIQDLDFTVTPVCLKSKEIQINLNDIIYIKEYKKEVEILLDSARNLVGHTIFVKVYRNTSNLKFPWIKDKLKPELEFIYHVNEVRYKYISDINKPNKNDIFINDSTMVDPTGNYVVKIWDTFEIGAIIEIKKG